MIFLDLLYLVASVFLNGDGGSMSLKTFVLTNQVKHGFVTQKTAYKTSLRPKSHELLTKRAVLLVLDCWMYTCHIDDHTLCEAQCL
jgi:hypothetical protein